MTNIIILYITLYFALAIHILLVLKINKVAEFRFRLLINNQRIYEEFENEISFDKMIFTYKSPLRIFSEWTEKKRMEFLDEDKALESVSKSLSKIKK